MMMTRLSWLLPLFAQLPQDLVPLPRSVTVEDGAAIRGSWVHCASPDLAPPVSAFAAALSTLGVDGESSERQAAAVTFRTDDTLAAEAYTVDCDGSSLAVRAGSPAAAAHAAATLLQLVDVEEGVAHWPRASIADRPDLPYRSFMVDMGRNPQSPTTLRRVVDMLWLFKVNLLQLHLGDDQLFSWPSKAFPKLYSERAGWTWDDFVELERYATARGVTLVPELEAPGHSTILRREYPEVFGTTPTELATRPEARAGLETLIDELLSVFRSTPYVHIGGDEAYGVPVEDQRALINHLNRHLRSRGRRTLVWEGPGLGAGSDKVDVDVLHLNWHTVGFPAQAMLDAGYEVVNASWNPLYVVDHYPRTMFTAVDVERCYRFDVQTFAQVDPGFPTFATPHRTRSAEGILGFCMPYWEGREENLFDLCLPRLSAVASAAWNRAGEQDFEGVLVRQARALARFEQLTGVRLAETPFAPPDTQTGNFAYRGRVTPSAGAVQPPFGPERLTNGIPDPFDHFLGFPTQPEPLEILIELPRPAAVGRVRVHERAVGGSHEVYQLLVSADGATFELVGEAGEGTRKGEAFVDHVFPARGVAFLKIVTRGCHGLTFPSFSRLSEVMAFRE